MAGFRPAVSRACVSPDWPRPAPLPAVASCALPSAWMQTNWADPASPDPGVVPVAWHPWAAKACVPLERPMFPGFVGFPPQFWRLQLREVEGLTRDTQQSTAGRCVPAATLPSATCDAGSPSSGLWRDGGGGAGGHVSASCCPCAWEGAWEGGSSQRLNVQANAS